MDPRALVGAWSSGGFELTIVHTSDGLRIRYPEAPEAFESALIPDEGGYVIDGGPLHGVRITFTTGDDGRPRGTVGPAIPLEPLDRAAEGPPGGGLRPPALELSQDETQRFLEVWEGIVRRPDGRSIDREHTGPPARFVQWLTGRDAVIFHGSKRDDIDEFVPVRASMEIRDSGGRGNLGAVYGTHDGLWAMFFAVIDRSRLRGSIRNGVTRYSTIDGSRTMDRYHFSIHHEMLEIEPFSTGTLYLLPRDAFTRLPLYPGGPLSDEWACPETVRPLARLAVEPEDFPFLEAIGGHDDGPLLELDDLGSIVYGALVSARRTGQGIEIVTTADRTVVDRFIELGNEFYPDVTRTAEAVAGGTRLSMAGPDAFIHAISKRLDLA